MQAINASTVRDLGMVFPLHTLLYMRPVRLRFPHVASVAERSFEESSHWRRRPHVMICRSHDVPFLLHRAAGARQPR